MFLGAKIKISSEIIYPLLKDIKSNVNQECLKRKRLKDLDVIVLDNSIRESTVGQLRGHTLENKWKIFDEVVRIETLKIPSYSRLSH